MGIYHQLRRLPGGGGSDYFVFSDYLSEIVGGGKRQLSAALFVDALIG